MITLLHSPEVTFSRDVQHVYRPIPSPGASDEELAQYHRDWSRPIAIVSDGTIKLSVRLDMTYTKDSQDLVMALTRALRDVLLEAAK